MQLSVMRRTGFCLVVSFLIACGAAPEPRPQAPAYEPSWESLTTHDVPEWLLDAKFGCMHIGESIRSLR